ncbi:MAG: hypothetical protein JXR37_07965 [Kiritimatiellae bacterium]|nr:hypothetical protein [Kiritimatiellia bacterium]
MICTLAPCAASIAGSGIPAAAKDDPLFKLGYLNVRHYSGVRNDGTGDSTAGMQQAIEDAWENRLAFFLPPGTYQVSETLKAYEWQLYKYRSGRPNRRNITHPDPRNYVFIGSSAGGSRPVIKLCPHAPAFDDPDRPRPILAIRNFTASNSNATERVEPEDTLRGVPPNFHDAPGINFNHDLRNIDFDLSAHPGAVAVTFDGAQVSSIENVRVQATGAYAGFYEIPGRDGGAANIEVEGGRYGLAKTAGAGSVVVGARFFNQTVSAIRSVDFVPLSVVGFHIRTRTAPAIRMHDANWCSAAGTLTLVDGKIEIEGGGCAIDNTVGKSLYIRNVYVNGATNLVRSGRQPPVPGQGTWQRIVEYAYTDQFTPDTVPPYAERTCHFRSFSVIDGKVSRAPEPVIRIESGTPPADIVTRHVWDELPACTGPGDGTAVITEYGAVADDEKDDWSAIQKAIDTSKSGKVFVPPGTYHISRPLVLGANTWLFGVGRHISRIESGAVWAGGKQSFLVGTVDDPNAATFLGYLTLAYAPSSEARAQGGIVRVLDWQAGVRSMTVGLRAVRKRGSSGGPRCYSYSFTGHAGGRHYFLERSVHIEGTGAPLTFYGLNVEGSKGSKPYVETNIEIRNARHVRIHNIKREGQSPTVIIRDSRDIGIFGQGRMNVRYAAEKMGGIVQVYGASDDIVMGVMVLDRGERAENALLLHEALAGRPPVGAAWPDNVSLYKRGDLSERQ